MKAEHIFLTGATGFIGGELLKKWILDNNKYQFWVLLRDTRNENSVERFQALLQKIAFATGRNLTEVAQEIHIVSGDIELPKFGLERAVYNKLIQKIDCIFHIAASVYLTAPLPILRKTNFGGTRNVLEFARDILRNGRLARLNYVSTAYVAGKRTGLILETDISGIHGFTNNYEHTKFEAEKLVEYFKKELPITIFRPSIVVGDSVTGRTADFNVIYGPIKLLYSGRMPIIPYSRQTRLDCVPVNYVCDAIRYLAGLEEEVLGKTFHLTVGNGKEISTLEIKNIANRYFNNRVLRYKEKIFLPSVHPVIIFGISKLIKPLLKRENRFFLKQLLTYTGYTYFYKNFDNQLAKNLLEPAGIVAPRLQTYLPKLLEYGLSRQFDLPHNLIAHLYEKPLHSNAHALQNM